MCWLEGTSGVTSSNLLLGDDMKTQCYKEGNFSDVKAHMLTQLIGTTVPSQND